MSSFNCRDFPRVSTSLLDGLPYRTKNRFVTTPLHENGIRPVCSWCRQSAATGRLHRRLQTAPDGRCRQRGQHPSVRRIVHGGRRRTCKWGSRHLEVVGFLSADLQTLIFSVAPFAVETSMRLSLPTKLKVNGVDAGVGKGPTLTVSL